MAEGVTEGTKAEETADGANVVAGSADAAPKQESRTASASKEYLIIEKQCNTGLSWFS
jgi:hypothetical protein